jgi:hypothetical protein
MLTQAQAGRLIVLLKEASSQRGFRLAEKQRIQFKLSMKRNPFEIRLHAFTRLLKDLRAEERAHTAWSILGRHLPARR